MERAGKRNKFLIKGGRVIDPSTGFDDRADVLIVGERIKKVGKSITPEGQETIIEAKDKIVMPGIVDTNVHISEPTRYDRETIGSVIRSAVSGGVSAFACKSNQDVIIDHQAIVAYLLRSAIEKGLAKLLPVCAMTTKLKGENIAEIGQMSEMGARACSDNTHSIMDSNLQRRILEYAYAYGLTPILYPEDRYLASGGVINEGYFSMLTGLPAIPSIAEEIMVNRDLILAEMTGVPIHIAPITTEGSVKLIREAKDAGIMVTCETCPHYFLLTDALCKDFNPLYKVKPPLRSERDKSAIMRAVIDGTIDVISSDHNPLTYSDKDTEFLVAEFGISGIETLFSLSYTYLVDRGSLSMVELLRRLSYTPSKILKHSGGRIATDAIADIAIVDIRDEYEINPVDFRSRGRNTPFGGYKVKGRVEILFIDGSIVYKDGKITPKTVSERLRE